MRLQDKQREESVASIPNCDRDERSTLRVPDITFFIPCYNEEKNVAGAMDKVVLACRATGMNLEIIVVDDASTDDTAAVAREWQALNPDVRVNLIRKEQNRGVARNFVDAAFAASGRHFRLICGDNIEPQETHEALLRQMGSADIVIPYFTEIRGRKLFRKIVSRLYTALVNLASGYQIRYYNGCPIFQRQDVLRYHVESTGFGYQAEFLTRLIHENRSYVEVPLIAYDRPGSTSINFKNLLSVAHSLFTIAMRRLRIVLFE